MKKLLLLLLLIPSLVWAGPWGTGGNVNRSDLQTATNVDIAGIVETTKYKPQNVFISSSRTLTTDEMYGSYIFVDTTSGYISISLTALQAQMGVAIVNEGTNYIAVTPDIGDTITFDGTTDNAGDTIYSAGALQETLVIKAGSVLNWVAFATYGTWTAGD